MAENQRSGRRSLLLCLGSGLIVVGVAFFALSAVVNWSGVPVLAGPFVGSGIGYVLWWRFFPTAEQRKASGAIKAENLAKLRAVEAEDRQRIAPLLKAQGYSASEPGRDTRASS